MAQKKKTGSKSPPPHLLPLVPAGLTLLIRTLFILEVRNLPGLSVSPQMVDAWAYHRWALEILHGNLWGSDVFFLRPLYPYLLALLYALFGVKPIAVQLFQALLAALSAFFLYRIAERVFNRFTALAAGTGFALCGVLVFYTGTLLYVELTIFLSLFTLYLLTVPRPTVLRFTLAGIAAGLFFICRPELLLLLPFLVWELTKRSTPRPPVIAFTLAALLTLATIPLRNLIVARDPVPFTAHSGINFYYGNNPAADGTWQPPPELSTGFGFAHERLKRVAKTVGGRELSWSKASAYWTGRGIRFIFTHPGRALRLLLRKFLLFFSNYEVPNNYYFDTVRPFSRVLKAAFLNFGATVALGLIGLFLARKNRRALPLYLFVAGYLFSALLFYVLSRLRAPVIPFLLVFAGFALSEARRLIKIHRRLRLALYAGLVLLLYLLTNLIPIDRKTYAAQAWTQFGNILLERHRFQAAIPAFRHALRLHPENTAARYSLILACAEARSTAEAEKELALLARTAPDARLLLHLAAARIAIAHRDFVSAARHYHTARELDPGNAETYYQLGLVQIAFNALDSARIYLERAVALDPEHEAAREALQKVLLHRPNR